MSRITLSKCAVDKLIEDPKLRQWREGEPGRRVPCLRYFLRSYSTQHDGTVTEYGDGFSLAMIDLADALETKGIVLKSVAAFDGFDILVGSDEPMMSGSFIIGWFKWKFTYEPEPPRSFLPLLGEGGTARQ